MRTEQFIEQMHIGIAKICEVLVSELVGSRKYYLSRLLSFALILARHLSICTSGVSTAGGMMPLIPSLFRKLRDIVVSVIINKGRECTHEHWFILDG